MWLPVGKVIALICFKMFCGDGPSVKSVNACGVKYVFWTLVVSYKLPSKRAPERALICCQLQGSARASNKTTRCIAIPEAHMSII